MRPRKGNISVPPPGMVAPPLAQFTSTSPPRYTEWSEPVNTKFRDSHGRTVMMRHRTLLPPESKPSCVPLLLRAMRLMGLRP